MLSIINKIRNLGADNQLPEFSEKKIRILNGVALIIGAVLFIVGIVIFFLMMPYEEFKFSDITEYMLVGSKSLFNKAKIIFTIIDLFGAFLCFLILVFNRYKKHNTAIITLWISALAFVTYFYWSAGVKVVFFYFIPAAISVIFFDRSKKYVIYSLITLLVVYVVSYLKNQTGNLLIDSFVASHKLLIYLINFTSVYAILILTIYYFKSENLKNEKKLQQKNSLLHEQSERIATQKHEIEEKNRDMTDSIRYAEKIQSAIFPQKDKLCNHFQGCYIYQKPKDIVSGDFYYLKSIGNYHIVAAADCTGHGVPGAFMTILGINFLDEIIQNEKNISPSIILEKLREQIKTSLIRNLNPDKSLSNVELYIHAGIRDGMDMAFCVYDAKNRTLHYAGANNPVIIVSENEVIETKATKNPIGIYFKELPFKEQKITINKGDMLYLFSDGYYDQFGGKKGKKFYYRKFKELLVKINHKPLSEQHQIIKNTFENWKGNYDQLDDVLVMGLRF